MNELTLAILAYLIGSIPTALWVSQYFFNIDIRDYGSGNSGATNTYRVLGQKWGTMVMLIDMLKGFIAVKLAFLLPFYVADEFARTNLQTWAGSSAGPYLPCLGTVQRRKRRSYIVWSGIGYFPLDGFVLHWRISAGTFSDKICFIKQYPGQYGIPCLYFGYF